MQSCHNLAMSEMSVGLSVCPSVCPLVWQTGKLWQNERKFSPQSYTPWKIFHHSFPTRSMVGRKRPLLPEILGQTDPVKTKTPTFNCHSLIAPQS